MVLGEPRPLPFGNPGCLLVVISSMNDFVIDVWAVAIGELGSTFWLSWGGFEEGIWVAHA